MRYINPRFTLLYFCLLASWGNKPSPPPHSFKRRTCLSLTQSATWKQRVLLEPSSCWRQDVCTLRTCPFVNADPLIGTAAYRIAPRQCVCSKQIKIIGAVQSSMFTLERNYFLQSFKFIHHYWSETDHRPGMRASVTLCIFDNISLRAGRASVVSSLASH